LPWLLPGDDCGGDGGGANLAAAVVTLITEGVDPTVFIANLAAAVVTFGIEARRLDDVACGAVRLAGGVTSRATPFLLQNAERSTWKCGVATVKSSVLEEMIL